MNNRGDCIQINLGFHVQHPRPASRWGTPLSIARTLITAAFTLAAANFVLLAIIGHYDFRLGPIHLAATYIFKPLLYLNAAFLMGFALKYRPCPVEEAPEARLSFRPGFLFWIAAVGVVAALYGISFQINLDFPDWTHRAITAHTKPWSFFLHRQYDGFYRPLTFVSLWVDNEVFGAALWGYHVQNLLIHLLNGFLAARLAFRLGLKQSSAAWAGIAFLAVPASFEAVIWPGARFDLMSAAFTFFALERALAGAAGMATAAYCLGVACKESAYAYPLLLAALFLLRRPLGLTLPKQKWFAALSAALAATIALVLVRISIYGNLGGYPDVATGGNVNFVLHIKTFTSVATRLPAALFLINTGAGLPVWLRATLIAYVAFLAVVFFSRIGAGRRTLLLLLPFLAVVPMLNMFGWMTQFAQQGRYLYHPVIWIVFVIVAGVSLLRFGSILLAAWVAIMMSAALFNTLVYVKMIHAVDVAVGDAAAACRKANCCRTLYLSNLPRDLNGAFYFGHQVTHNLQTALPGVAIISTGPLPSESSCGVGLRWTDQNAWTALTNSKPAQ